MKHISICVVILMVCDVFCSSEEWTSFKEKFGRDYKSTIEEKRRYSIFQENLRKIAVHNEDYRNGKSSYFLGVNEFADMTTEEFNQRLGTLRLLDISEDSRIKNLSYRADLPESIDWRDAGAVSAVANQGNCGSCYIFGSLGSIESQYYLQSGTLISLSAQQILDCDKYNSGCTGGWISNVFEQIRESGATLEQDYPTYQASVEQCRANGTLFKGMGFFSIARNEIALKNAVASYGPVSVLIDATDMYLYAGGVYYNPSCSFVYTNHAVLVVGYGTENGQDYWLVKNSWGKSFGLEGYIKMARNKNNHCAIANSPYIPTL